MNNIIILSHFLVNSYNSHLYSKIKRIETDIVLRENGCAVEDYFVLLHNLKYIQIFVNLQIVQAKVHEENVL